MPIALLPRKLARHILQLMMEFRSKLELFLPFDFIATDQKRKQNANEQSASIEFGIENENGIKPIGW